MFVPFATGQHLAVLYIVEFKFRFFQYFQYQYLHHTISRCLNQVNAIFVTVLLIPNHMIKVTTTPQYIDTVLSLSVFILISKPYCASHLTLPVSLLCSLQVGFFPSECVELINDKVPQSMTNTVPKPGTPVPPLKPFTGNVLEESHH